MNHNNWMQLHNFKGLGFSLSTSKIHSINAISLSWDRKFLVIEFMNNCSPISSKRFNRKRTKNLVRDFTKAVEDIKKKYKESEED